MDIVVGIGEIGKPWLNLISTVRKTVAVDLDPKKNQEKQCRGEHIDILHICIPYSKDFVDIAVSYALKFEPKTVVIHSTVKPFTTKKLQDLVEQPVIFSPIRGIHRRMERDIMRYTKFYASYRDNCKLYENLLLAIGSRSYRMKTPHALEFAKILTDTTYYGYLIAYAMKTEEITMKYDIDYNEMWIFAYEINNYLKNRPPCGIAGENIYPDPKGIGGHCVLPNLELIKDDLPEICGLINKINKACIERHL